jgi:hypothetical protein
LLPERLEAVRIGEPEGLTERRDVPHVRRSKRVPGVKGHHEFGDDEIPPGRVFRRDVREALGDEDRADRRDVLELHRDVQVGVRPRLSPATHRRPTRRPPIP